VHSEAMREIVSGRADFITRWGLLFFIVVIVVVLITSWFVQYPEIITTRAILIGTNAPREVLTREDGKLVRMFVRNNDNVKTGDILAWMESTADHRQVLQLSGHLDSILVRLRQNRPLNMAELIRLNLGSLGELQTGYQQFIAAYQQFMDYQPGGYYFKRAAVLRSDADGIEKTLANLEREKQMLLQDLALTEANYRADETLYVQKVVSQQENRDQQSKLLNKQLTIPKLTADILSSQMQQRDKQKEIASLDHDFSIQRTIFQQAAQTLQSTVEDWKRKYLITAAVGGKISLVYPVQENQFIRNGVLLGFINPVGSSFYAEVNLPQNNFGKVEAGQRVQLRFDAYPYNEFGHVNGRLEYISNIATDSGFVAYIRLPDGLVTNQHKSIQYKSGLKADAVIITREMRLMERLLYGLLKVVKQ